MRYKSIESIEKIGMLPPALLGLAIDKSIRVIRQKIKEEKL